MTRSTIITTTSVEEAALVAAVVSAAIQELEDEEDVNKETQEPTNAAADGDDDDEESSGDISIPEEFVCPLTLELFEDPLMDRRGMNFEREAILEWLNRGNLTCPLTREPLGYRSLIPNVNLRARVQHWKKEHGYEVSSLNKRKEHYQHKFIGLIEAPVDSSLELRWTQVYMAERAQEIIRRVEAQLQQQETAAAANNNEATATNSTSSNTNNNGNGRRRRRGLTSRTGLSPATQQRRLVGFLGEALNIVRRPPLVES